jgi:tetratricopeptide (TPR) repeat protein
MLNRVLITMLLLFLGSSAVDGQTVQNRGTSSIVGSIVLPTNQAMERYDVLLLAKDADREFAHTYTDLTGRYRFTDIVPGAYDVVVRIEGFEEARVQARLTANYTSTINMILTPKEATAVDPDQWNSEVVNIAELTRAYPKKSVDDYQKAVDARHKGDVPRATELLEGVLKSTPDFYVAHNLLGAIYQSMDRYRDAEKQYNAALTLKAASTTPLLNLATLYLQEAAANDKEGPFVTGVMYDDALHVLQNAARMDPRNPKVFFLLGITFYKSHSDRIAEASFNAALSIDANMGPARLALGNLYIRQQRWKDALNQLDMYLAENPKASDRAQIEAVRTKVIQQL